jgi:hypothetical protein
MRDCLFHSSRYVRFCSDRSFKDKCGTAAICVRVPPTNDNEGTSDDNIPDDRAEERLQMEIERALHSIVEVADYLEQPGNAISILRDQVVQVLGHGTRSNIDWQATGLAMAKVTFSRRHGVSKHSSGFCGTSQMMLRWGN